MPRVARKCVNSNYVHIMTQGIKKEKIFAKEKYKLEYIKLWKKYFKENTKLLVYCVMDNHAHMLIYMTDIKKLSEIMQKINTSYGIYYNKQENRVGHVFRNRYNMKEIESEGHLLRAIAYIHKNPLKANLVNKIEDYKFSSYNLYKEGKISEEIIQLTFKTSYYMKLFDFIHNTLEESLMFEKEEGEDELLWSLEVDVSEETNVEMMVNGACISFETVWESFEEEERVVFDAKMNFVGVGVSVINGTPEELLYVSLLGLRSDIKVMNRGKKVIELELNSFQIDNQISGAKYEVLLDTPSAGTWLSATVVIQPHPSLLYLELFSVLMQNVRVFADSGVIMNILSFVQELPFDIFEKIERDCMKQISESPLFIR